MWGVSSIVTWYPKNNDANPANIVIKNAVTNVISTLFELVARVFVEMSLIVKNIAEIIQRVNPDILLLNEFDYIADKRIGIEAFMENYLNVSQQGLEPVDYPYTYVAPVNTGEPTTFDLDNNGKAEGIGGDAQRRRRLKAPFQAVLNHFNQ